MLLTRVRLNGMHRRPQDNGQDGRGMDRLQRVWTRLHRLGDHPRWTMTLTMTRGLQFQLHRRLIRLFCTSLEMSSKAHRQLIFHLLPLQCLSLDSQNIQLPLWGQKQCFHQQRLLLLHQRIQQRNSCLFRRQADPTKQPGIRLPSSKRYQEEVDGDGTGGRMDESFKRNRDVFEDDDELFGFEYIPADVSPPWFPNHLWGIPTTIQHNATDWNDKSWYPSYQSSDMDPAVPFPVHVQGIKSWASTKIKLKKWRDKDMSYHEFILKVFNHDDEAGQYAKWILAHYTPKITATPKSQAPDLAAFLKKMRVDVFLYATTAYRRELMNVDFDKKP